MDFNLKAHRKPKSIGTLLIALRKLIILSTTGTYTKPKPNSLVVPEEP